MLRGAVFGEFSEGDTFTMRFANENVNGLVLAIDPHHRPEAPHNELSIIVDEPLSSIVSVGDVLWLVRSEPTDPDRRRAATR